MLKLIDLAYPDEKAKGKGGKKGGKGGASAEPVNEALDVSRLDLRVARIVSAKMHPDADSLYVEDGL